MDFEEIQVIWTQQDDQPIFNIDPDRVVTRLQEETRAVHSGNLWLEPLFMLSAGFNVYGSWFRVKPDELTLWGIAFGLVSFVAVIWFFTGFLKRRREALILDQPIRGILESDVVNYRTSNKITWRGIWLVTVPSISREVYRLIMSADPGVVDWSYPELIGFPICTAALILVIRYQSRRIEKLLSFRRQLD